MTRGKPNNDPSARRRELKDRKRPRYGSSPAERIEFFSSDPDPDTGCINWKGSTNRKGYGTTIKEYGRGTLAHRIAFELRNGAIPDGLEIDHLCRNRRCVNPDHLEAVTHQENCRRAIRTHCINGHEFTPENTRPIIGGGRRCLICERAYSRKSKANRRIEKRRSEFLPDHHCSVCRDGEKPCVQGHPNRCEYPRARND